MLHGMREDVSFHIFVKKMIANCQEKEKFKVIMKNEKPQ